MQQIKQKIVLILIDSPKTNGELLVSLFGEDNKKAFNRIDGPLRSLNSSGIIIQEGKPNVKGPGAKPTLNSLSPNFYNIGGFDASVEDEECIKIGLKYSPTFLDDLIEKKITPDTLLIFLNVKIRTIIEIMESGAHIQTATCEKIAEERNQRGYWQLIGKNADKAVHNTFILIKENIRKRPIPFLVCNYIDLETLKGTISSDILNSESFKEDTKRIMSLAYGGVIGENNLKKVYDIIGF